MSYKGFTLPTDFISNGEDELGFRVEGFRHTSTVSRV